MHMFHLLGANSIMNSTSFVVDKWALFTAVTLRKYMALASLTAGVKVYRESERLYKKTSQSPIAGQ